MLNIEHLRLRLPPGFKERSANITFLVGKALADLEFSRNQNVERLIIPPIRVSSQATDRVVARAVAEGIAAALGVKP